MSHEVIYLTGTAGVGKSTLSSRLKRRFSHLEVYEYGALLAQSISTTAARIEQRDLKEKSSLLITKEHIEKLDDWLIEEIQLQRKRVPLLVDSHAVTMESFGFRITPFSSEKITALHPTRIVLLTAPPAAIVDRVSKDSGGRPVPTPEQVERHLALQLAVAVNYSVATGTPLYEIATQDGNDNALALISNWIEQSN